MKYIIEIKPEYEDKFRGVMLLGAEASNLYVDSVSVDELEELNSDYINEHYGDLQDDAYQRGLEDAWEAARKIVRMSEGDLLNIFTECYSAVCTALQVLLKYDASEAIEKLKAYEEKQKAEDEIKVGDIVERYLNGKLDSTGIYLGENDGHYNCLFWTGTVFDTFAYPKNQFKRTGRHFDIASILKEMQP